MLATQKNQLSVIGKAESLKLLLIEWMQRNDGAPGYYSSPRYSYGQSRGDIQEIKLRRTWKQVPLWLSDSSIPIPAPTKVGNTFRRNEYLYLGRTISGTVKVTSITVKGTHASYFTVSPTMGTIGQNGSMRVTISFASQKDVSKVSLNAYLDIRTSEGDRVVSLRGV